MKWVIRGLLGLIAIIILVVVIALIYVDTIAKSAVEYAATTATGCKTTLRDISVGVFSGTVTLDDLEMANPEGWGDLYFFKLGHGATGVRLSSLMEETVVVPKLELDDLTINLIQKGSESNYQTILDNLSKLQSKNEETKEAESKKGFVINEILINNITVNANIDGTEIPVKIDQIRLTNIGSNTDQGVLLSEVTGIIIQAIFKAIVQNAPDILPKIMINGLNNGLKNVGDLGQYGFETLGNVVGTLPGGEHVEKALGGLGKGTNEVFDKSGDAIKGAGEGLGNIGKDLGGLFGNKKEEQPAEEEKK
ncbi:hypothetical protein [Poriferisphaera sp. WC338]|uniref:DUF748 domain-containing protein n=1 Tax=Poriferisphaera sp. WC338 TaxID=3425129 RepID=UPI003D8182AD